ncbi:MAG: T9SS type A sorting domain-containing protein [Bacteroidia bacterium]|nr:T9SS type A sorting domain-containing protein [Bacteroidia bacterium]
MVFKGTQANISDANGNLLMSSNGVWIANATGDTMMNGGGLAPSYLTTAWPYGIPLNDGAICLPFPGDSNKLVLFHKSKWDQFSISTTALYKTIINLSLDSIIQKNDTIITDTLSWGVGACKHANGRDWWLFVSQDGNPKFYTFLITPNGIDTIFTQQLPSLLNTYGNVSPIKFSPNGEKMIWCSPVNQTQSGYVLISDFNRCNGIISNTIIYPVSSTNYLFGLAFSPSGKYAYACSSNYIFQIDTDNQTVDTVAVYDGFISPPGFTCCATTFWGMYLAANGKIYITSGSGVQHLHEMNYPDSAGVACDVQQHSISLGYAQLRSVPNHPNYYLGCDTTLGCTPCYTNVDELSPPDFKFRVYPNPVNDGILNIGYLLPQNKHGIFEMYDITGKVVFRYTLPPWSNYQNFKLPQLSDGIYQCVITSDGKRAVKKVAVIKE